MAVGSGLGATMGLGIETAGNYGTAAAPNQWPPFDSCEIKRAPVVFHGSSLHGGTLVREDAEVVITNMDAAGTIKQPWFYSNMQRLTGSLMGSLGITPTQLGTTGTAYQGVHAFQNSWHQSLTIQQGIPDVAGTVHYWQSFGAKVTQGQFECSAGNPLLATWTVDAQDFYELGSGTPPTAPGGSSFYAWHQMAVKIGTYGSEAKVDGVSKWTGTIKRAQADKRFNAGNVSSNSSLIYGIKDEPVDNGFADIGGTLETEYLNDTVFENYWTTQTPFSLIISYTSAVLAGTGNPYSVTFAFPRCRFLSGEDPTVPGPDIVKPALPYEVMLDGTHPAATITVVSQETAL